MESPSRPSPEDFRITPLSDITDERVAALTVVLAPVFRRLAGAPIEPLIAKKLEQDQVAECGYFLLEDSDGPAGFFGWMSTGEPGLLETDTFLAERLWGTGLNKQLKDLQFQVADSLGCALLLAVDAKNTRSAWAVSKCWPEERPERLWSETRKRTELVWRVTTPPDGYQAWDDISSYIERVQGLANPALVPNLSPSGR